MLLLIHLSIPYICIVIRQVSCTDVCFWRLIIAFLFWLLQESKCKGPVHFFRWLEGGFFSGVKYECRHLKRFRHKIRDFTDALHGSLSLCLNLVIFLCSIFCCIHLLMGVIIFNLMQRGSLCHLICFSGISSSNSAICLGIYVELWRRKSSENTKVVTLLSLSSIIMSLWYWNVFSLFLRFSPWVDRSELLPSCTLPHTVPAPKSKEDFTPQKRKKKVERRQGAAGFGGFWASVTTHDIRGSWSRCPRLAQEPHSVANELAQSSASSSGIIPKKGWIRADIELRV